MLMRRRRSSIFLFLLLVGVVAMLAAQQTRPSAHKRMARAAVAFLESLAPELREQAIIPFDDQNRFDWNIVPRPGRGVRLDQLSDEQKRKVHDLLRAALSEQGYLKVTSIIHLEEILREIESRPGRPANHRDPGLYRVTIFGDPAPGPAPGSETEPWGWRVEGHHLALNFSSVTRELTAVTPLFLGANPAEVPYGPHAGWRVLGGEEDLARELVTSLDDEQRAKAVIAGSAPRDVIFGPGRDDFPASPEGIAFTDLSQDQKRQLSELLVMVLGNIEPDVAMSYSSNLRELLGGAWFAWAGEFEPRRPHYWRIHTPSFIIEYDNTQNDANHVHLVWRDLTNDFGRHWLREHHEAHEHD